jgi:hypothetical protein
MTDVALEPGSFRDRTARVFYHQDRIFRGLTDTASREWQALSGTAFFRRFTDSGGIVFTQQRERARRGHEPEGRPVRHQPLPAARIRHANHVLRASILTGRSR